MTTTLNIRRRALNRHITSAVVAIVFIFAGETALAQLVVSPIQRTAPDGKTGKSNTSARKSSDHTLTLPFWDDFSFTSVHFNEKNVLAGYPLDSLWDNSYDTTGRSYGVWVKSGVEIDAPSVNVATLDGIDSTGRAYDTDPSANGIRDELTSRPIDLSIAEVDLLERSSVYLSFFYQWRGNGEPPDDLDYLRVEFLDENDEWVLAASITYKSDLQRNEFYDTLIKVNGEPFFHDAFRFRFRSYGRLSGPFDTWNLDYIYLDKGRNPDNNSYEDAALASPAGPLFGSYFSVPYHHFNPALPGNVKLDVFNLRTDQSTPDPYTYRTTGTFTNFVDGLPIVSTVLLTATDRPVRPGVLLLGPRERFTIETLPGDRPNPADVSQFDPAADSVDVKLNFLLLSDDNGFFQSNDTVSATYRLKDYYAYDDGTAEYTVSVNDNDDQAAVRFDMNGYTDADVISAFDIHIPVFNISGFLTADFFIMDADENGMPRDVISSVSAIIRRTSRDKFQRIPLSKPVSVQGSFFVGWKGSFTSTLYIGIDTDSNTGEMIYVNPSGIWQQNNSVEGSLMIRPVFGEAGPATGVEEDFSLFDVFPNPSSGSFYITGNPDEIRITTVSGQQVRFTSEKQDEGIRVHLGEERSGLYIVQIKKGAALETKKIVLR